MLPKKKILCINACDDQLAECRALVSELGFVEEEEDEENSSDVARRCAFLIKQLREDVRTLLANNSNKDIPLLAQNDGNQLEELMTSLSERRQVGLALCREAVLRQSDLEMELGLAHDEESTSEYSCSEEVRYLKRVFEAVHRNQQIIRQMFTKNNVVVVHQGKPSRSEPAPPRPEPQMKKTIPLREELIERVRATEATTERLAELTKNQSDEMALLGVVLKQKNKEFDSLKETLEGVKAKEGRHEAEKAALREDVKRATQAAERRHRLSLVAISARNEMNRERIEASREAKSARSIQEKSESRQEAILAVVSALNQQLTETEKDRDGLTESVRLLEASGVKKAREFEALDRRFKAFYSNGMTPEKQNEYNNLLIELTKCKSKLAKLERNAFEDQLDDV